MAFDVTRKVTYKNLDRWYKELEEYCPGRAVLVVPGLTALGFTA